MCNPQGGMDAIVPWPTILGNQQPYEIARAHASDDMVKKLFKPFGSSGEEARKTAIFQWMEQIFGELRSTRRRYRAGFDIAASGEGDLGCFYVGAKEAGQLKLRGLLTTRTEDWHFIESAGHWLMTQLSDIHMRGDETGLGRSTCWEFAARYPQRFAGLGFSKEKVNLGTLLMGRLAEMGMIMPDSIVHQDIPADFFALRKVMQGGKVIFSEGPNEFNDASHCDIAWAGALACRAEADSGQAFGAATGGDRPRGRRVEGL